MLDRILVKPTNRKAVRLLLKEQDLINILRQEEIDFLNTILNLENTDYTYLEVYNWHLKKFNENAKKISKKIKYTEINLTYFSDKYKPIEKEYANTILTTINNKLRK